MKTFGRYLIVVLLSLIVLRCGSIDDSEISDFRSGKLSKITFAMYIDEQLWSDSIDYFFDYNTSGQLVSIIKDSTEWTFNYIGDSTIEIYYDFGSGETTLSRAFYNGNQILKTEHYISNREQFEYYFKSVFNDSLLTEVYEAGASILPGIDPIVNDNFIFDKGNCISYEYHSTSIFGVGSISGHVNIDYTDIPFSKWVPVDILFSKSILHFGEEVVSQSPNMLFLDLDFHDFLRMCEKYFIPTQSNLVLSINTAFFSYEFDENNNVSKISTTLIGSDTSQVMKLHYY